MALSALPVFSDKTQSAPVAAELNKGDRVRGVNSLLVVKHPAPCTIRQPVTATRLDSNREIRITPGSTVSVYYGEGEGYSVADYNGTLVSAPVAEHCKMPAVELWLQVRLPSGALAWTNDRSKFQGTSRYDDQLPAVAVAVPQPPPAPVPATQPTYTGRTGFGFRIGRDDLAVYRKSSGVDIIDHLSRGAYVANAKGSFLGVPKEYQLEQENGRTKIAYPTATNGMNVGWVESDGLGDRFTYACSCEAVRNRCDAIRIVNFRGAYWSDCFERARAGR